MSATHYYNPLEIIGRTLLAAYSFGRPDPSDFELYWLVIRAEEALLRWKLSKIV